MARSSPSWVSLTTVQQAELEPLGTMSGWQLLSRESIPSVFPRPFREKLDSALVICASAGSGSTWLVCNATRPDRPAGKLDQEPFAIILQPSGAASLGMFLHHGKWRGRTQEPPTNFWQHVDQSGIGNYFLAHPPSGLTRGSLDQLPVGHIEAFESAISHYRVSQGRS